jgi:serine/threonine protein kinase
MQYVDGGTLAQEIKRKSRSSPVEPYAEQRIAFYALQVREGISFLPPCPSHCVLFYLIRFNTQQLCNALAFSHERGVAHHDVKSANILIDASAGGRLLLADFGTALKPGEETVGFTKSYTSPGVFDACLGFILRRWYDSRPTSASLHMLMSSARIASILRAGRFCRFETRQNRFVCIGCCYI